MHSWSSQTAGVVDVVVVVVVVVVLWVVVVVRLVVVVVVSMGVHTPQVSGQSARKWSSSSQYVDQSAHW
jgi:hypothetical protein